MKEKYLFDEGKMLKINLINLKLIFYFDRNCSHLKPVNLLKHY